jgi:hypothetical protein
MDKDINNFLDGENCQSTRGPRIEHNGPAFAQFLTCGSGISFCKSEVSKNRQKVRRLQTKFPKDLMSARRQNRKAKIGPV